METVSRYRASERYALDEAPWERLRMSRYPQPQGARDILREHWRLVRAYGPALLAVALAAVQAAFLLAQERVRNFREMLVARNRGRTQHAAAEAMWIRARVRVETAGWMNASGWDGVACAVASGAILCALCSVGLTEFGWILLAPVVALGGMATAFHLLDGPGRPSPAGGFWQSL